MKRPTHEELLEGKVNTTSIINEPVVDFEVNFVVTARAMAQRRWAKADLIEGGRKNETQ